MAEGITKVDSALLKDSFYTKAEVLALIEQAKTAQYKPYCKDVIHKAMDITTWTNVLTLTGAGYFSRLVASTLGGGYVGGSKVAKMRVTIDGVVQFLCCIGGYTMGNGSQGYASGYAESSDIFFITPYSTTSVPWGFYISEYAGRTSGLIFGELINTLPYTAATFEYNKSAMMIASQPYYFNSGVTVDFQGAGDANTTNPADISFSYRGGIKI